MNKEKLGLISIYVGGACAALSLPTQLFGLLFVGIALAIGGAFVLADAVETK